MIRNKLRWDANNAVGLSKLGNSYQSSPTTQNLVISRCRFAEDGKEMYQEL